MKTEKLQEWEQELIIELNDLKARRNELDLEIQRLSKKLELVKQMMALEGTTVEPGELEQSPIGARTTPANVRGSAKGILLEAGRPLHINDIHRKFVEKGYAIPGGGTPFNILVHLTNSGEFVRVARGTYALAGTVPETQVIPKAARRSFRRKKRKRKGSQKEQ